jgi:hypothetical protein
MLNADQCRTWFFLPYPSSPDLAMSTIEPNILLHRNRPQLSFIEQE